MAAPPMALLGNINVLIMPAAALYVAQNLKGPDAKIFAAIVYNFSTGQVNHQVQTNLQVIENNIIYPVERDDFMAHTINHIIRVYYAILPTYIVIDQIERM